VVNPSVVDGRRGGGGRHCPLFHVLRCGVSKSFAAQEKRGSLWNRCHAIEVTLFSSEASLQYPCTFVGDETLFISIQNSMRFFGLRKGSPS
jgi:hypothetical protein